MRALSVFACAILTATALSAQDSGRPDSDDWQRFFRTANMLSHIPPADSNQLAKPTLQDDLGFTGAEMQLLNPIATNCLEKAAAVPQPKPGEVFEARLRTLQSGEESNELAQRLKTLDEQVDRIVFEHVRQAERALGPTSFQRLSDYVAAHHFQRCYLGPCPVAKK